MPFLATPKVTFPRWTLLAQQHNKKSQQSAGRYDVRQKTPPKVRITAQHVFLRLRLLAFVAKKEKGTNGGTDREIAFAPTVPRLALREHVTAKHNNKAPKKKARRPFLSVLLSVDTQGGACFGECCRGLPKTIEILNIFWWYCFVGRFGSPTLDLDNI